MRTIAFSLFFGLVACNAQVSPIEPSNGSIVNPNPNAASILPTTDSDRVIQMAILFDASGSMDGLLTQAKSRIWTIVNDLSTLRYDGKLPRVEIALYDYGRDDISAKENHVRMLVPLSTDLDLISSKLFAIHTNGGSEYCGAVIQSSLGDLKWSNNPSDLKMIYIAGNEGFDQGTIDYQKVIPKALQREIYVNTIYCGPQEQGVLEHWFDGAKLGGGDYFNIDSDRAIAFVKSPYDDAINYYNDSLNRTYVGYGQLGAMNKQMQSEQDANAGTVSYSVKAERTIAKSSTNYTNSSWDLVDAQKAGTIKIKEMKESELPDEFKGLTPAQREAKLKTIETKRLYYQKNIGELAKKREAFLAEESKKNSTGQDDFGTSISKSIDKKATKIGYVRMSN